MCQIPPWSLLCMDFKMIQIKRTLMPRSLNLIWVTLLKSGHSLQLQFYSDSFVARWTVLVLKAVKIAMFFFDFLQSFFLLYLVIFSISTIQLALSILKNHPLLQKIFLKKYRKLPINNKMAVFGNKHVQSAFRYVVINFCRYSFRLHTW